MIRIRIHFLLLQYQQHCEYESKEECETYYRTQQYIKHFKLKKNKLYIYT